MINFFADGEYTIKVRSYDGMNYSEEVTVTVNVENKDDGDGDFLPGFGAATVVGAIGLMVIANFIKRKKEWE